MVEIERAAIDENEELKVQRQPPNDDCLSEPPKLLAWLASLVTMSLIPVSQFLARGDAPYLRGAGVLLLLLAAVFIFAPFYLLTKYGGKDGQTYMQARTVVDRGLYAITCHPQYLGYMFFAYGFALLSQHWLVVLLATVGATLFYIQAVREERYCLTQLGEPYKQYLQRVPRFNIILGLIRLLQGAKVRGN